LALDGSNEELKNTGIMVNADGDFVIAKPDKAAWELYQEKAKASAAAAAEAAAAEGSKELRERGLECPIDKRMFLEPTKTPCCKRTYCNDCITNALIESDFVCPGCSTEGVLLDNLSVDDETVAKLKAYEAEKAEERKERERQQQGQDAHLKASEEEANRSPQSKPSARSPALSSRPTSTQSKKRPAEEEDAKKEGSENGDRAPSMKKQKSQDRQTPMDSSDVQAKDPLSGFSSLPFSQPMPFGGFGFMQSQGMPSMPFADNGFIPGNMGFMNPMMAPSANCYPASMENGWSQMNNMDFMSQPNRMYNESINGAMMSNNCYGSPNMYNGMGDVSVGMNAMGQMAGHIQQQSAFQQGPGISAFSNQQRTTFSAPFAREEDNAYFRQPVNPHRHQARQRRIRPSDYREL